MYMGTQLTRNNGAGQRSEHAKQSKATGSERTTRQGREEEEDNRNRGEFHPERGKAACRTESKA